MTEATAIAVLAAVTTILTTGVTAIVVPLLLGTRRRLRRLERRDRLSWLYIRSLIDHAYRHGATPLPLPPEGWSDEDTE